MGQTVITEPLQGLVSDPALRRFDDVRQLISTPENPTPLLRVNKALPAESPLELYLKLEWFNPFGSIKDRTAWFLLKGLAVGVSPDGGFKYASFFEDILGDEGKPAE